MYAIYEKKSDEFKQNKSFQDWYKDMEPQVLQKLRDDNKIVENQTKYLESISELVGY